MPSLIAFNRKWRIGSDDFVFPGLVEIFLRFVWLIAISIVYNLHTQSFLNCNGGFELKLYYIGLLTLMCVCIVITIVIVFISSRGSITNLYPRRRLAKVLYVRIAIGIPELVWNILGTYWSFGRSSGCKPAVVTTVKGAVMCGWLLAFIVLILFLVTFDPLGGRKKKPIARNKSSVLESKNSEQIMSNARIAARKAWERRCKLLCCCLICDDQSKDAFGDIAKLIAEFFEGIDLVPTDIAAGLILEQQKQEKKENQLTTVMTESYSHQANSSASLTHDQPTEQCIPTPKDWMTTEMMAHYMKFAMGSYGWPLYIFTHLTTGLCRICGGCRISKSQVSVSQNFTSCLSACWESRCQRQNKEPYHNLYTNAAETGLSEECFTCMVPSGEVSNDNCCQCHTAAIRKFTRIPDEDLVYVSFHNEIYEIPFYVAIDREKQAVVVAIRGTLSLRDALTDMTADCETLEIECFAECMAHKGILQAAQFVKQKLEDLHILETAFQKAQGGRLVVTGHSLGAGAAALLSLMLKPDYPDIMCFAYSPPGGLMGYKASCVSQEFICSVILGKDLVPRLSVPTMEDLKTKILKEIRNCDIPKYRILMSGIWQLFCGFCSGDDKDKVSDRPLLQRPIIPSYVNGNMKSEIENFIMCSEQCRITNTPMYPPGQIMHILEVEQDSGCCSTPNYYAEWKSNTDFNEILVSPDMLSDHLPDNVMIALEQLSSKSFTPRVHERRKTNIETTEL